MPISGVILDPIWILVCFATTRDRTDVGFVQGVRNPPLLSIIISKTISLLSLVAMVSAIKDGSES